MDFLWRPRGIALDLRLPNMASGSSAHRQKKMIFSKAAEHFSTFDKEPDRHPRAFYELEDLNGTPIDGQF